MHLIKPLGKLFDKGRIIELPIVATQTGKYKIRVERPSGNEIQRLFDAEIGENLELPNFNGKKTLEHGLNVIYAYQPDGSRLVIDKANKFEIQFEAVEQVVSGPVPTALIHKITIGAAIWEVPNPDGRSYSILPDNPMGIRIDYLDSSTEDKIIIDWKHIPRTGAIQLH